MSRAIFRLLVLALSAAIQPAVANAASGDSIHGRLTWTYPCEFIHADKTPIVYAPTGPHCDYIHSQVYDAARQFNQLPTLAAQFAFLRETNDQAIAAEKRKQLEMDALLKATDPNTIPADRPDGARLKNLLTFHKRLRQGRKVCEFFLWPGSASYSDESRGTWPDSWEPCMKPVYARWNELDALIQSLQVVRMSKTRESMGRNITSIPSSAAHQVRNKTTAVDGAVLAKIYDGEAARPDRAQEIPKRVSMPPPSVPMPPRNLDELIFSHPKKISDLNLAPPPVPSPIVLQKTVLDEAQRPNYRARGYAAAIRRLLDRTHLAVRRSMGRSTTVGDPRGKAPLIVRQRGPSCGVAAQYVALRARGLPVDIADLTKEGIEKGYYSEFEMNSGRLAGGTYADNNHKLLVDHGVAARVSYRTTPAQLVDSIRAQGDALVMMSSKRLWNDSSLPDGAGHVVYVSGAEVDAKNNPLGFYINDTGIGESARFIPIKDFNRAWQGRDNTAVLFDAEK
jgi:hypothetical protein